MEDGYSLKGDNLAIGEIIYYGGMGGISLAVIGLIVLSQIFKRQRKKMRDELNVKVEGE